ncbi:MAG: methylamine utilization protein [Burkholderiales bacterium]|nr:methylamine utilization protein [Opitutaceae bacterium]
MTPRLPVVGLLAGLAALFASAASLPAAELVLTLADAKGKPVANAVVSLIPLDQAAPPATEPAPEITIAQRDSEFVPLVVAVRAGTSVRFPNEDKIQHHVYSLSAAKRFDLPLHGGDTAPAVPLDQPGVVSVGCNIHDWMRSYVVVLDTPWFARSDADGVVRLAAPAGRYRREIWHYRLAQPLAEEIALAGETPLAASATLALRRDRHPVRPHATDPSYP